MMRVLIVEDDGLHRAFLKEAVERMLPECEEVLEADDGDRAVEDYLGAGVMHLLNDDLQLDAHVGYGLNGLERDYFLGLRTESEPTKEPPR